MQKLALLIASVIVFAGCASNASRTATAGPANRVVVQSTTVTNGGSARTAVESGTARDPGNISRDADPPAAIADPDAWRQLPGTAPRPGPEGLGSPADATSGSGTSRTGSRSVLDTATDPATANTFDGDSR
jgi:hypothetical protein